MYDPARDTWGPSAQTRDQDAIEENLSGKNDNGPASKDVSSDDHGDTPSTPAPAAEAETEPLTPVVSVTNTPGDYMQATPLLRDLSDASSPLKPKAEATENDHSSEENGHIAAGDEKDEKDGQKEGEGLKENLRKGGDGEESVENPENPTSAESAENPENLHKPVPEVQPEDKPASDLSIAQFKPVSVAGLSRFKRKRHPTTESQLEKKSETPSESSPASNASSNAPSNTPSNAPSNTPSDAPQAQTPVETLQPPQSSSITDDSEEPPKKLKRPSRRPDKETQEQRARELREKLALTTSNEADHVKSHYNQRPNQRVEERRNSPIFALRTFNNFIKSVLIQKFSSRKDKVLDIGIGKGGDFKKWMNAKVDGIIGVDLADVSIEQAQDRYDNIRNPHFWVDLMAADAFTDTLVDIFPPGAFPVDIVSSQFCVHYAFKSEQTARKLLSNVSECLKPGGFFIGTMPDSDVIKARIEAATDFDEDNKNNGKDSEVKFGNSLYRVLVPELFPLDFKSVFGNKYYFYLEDAIEDVPEYVVPFEEFRRLASEYDLALEYRENFLDMFKKETANRPSLFDLCKRMSVYDSQGKYGIDGDEAEASGFYLAFGFRKTR